MSMPGGTQVPVPVTDCRLERLGHEVLLYCPATTSTIFLNETAALIWTLCDGRRNVGEILDLLRAAYPESADDVATDVDSTLERLAAGGALRFS